jgi:hypothetical protein
MSRVRCFGERVVSESDETLQGAQSAAVGTSTCDKHRDSMCEEKKKSSFVNEWFLNAITTRHRIDLT